MSGLMTANSVERAFAILEYLNTSQRGGNISEISRKLDLPKSSTHVLMSTLKRLGYIKESPAGRRFHLSSKMYGLGQKALHANPVHELALPHMHWAVRQSGLTAHLGILENRQVIFVQKVDGPGLIKFDTYLGKCSELHCTALGKALLAYRSQDVVNALLERYKFARFTRNTICSSNAFGEELVHVQKQGYAIDDEEEELGIRCVAAPVFDSRGVIAAVSFTGTTAQLQLDALPHLVKLTKTTAARISAQC